MAGNDKVNRAAPALADLEAILDSTLFDHFAYSGAVGRRMSRLEAVEHYLMEGEEAGFAPSAMFDPDFYKTMNEDVSDAGINLFVHFIRHGTQEGRYGSRARLASEAAEVALQVPDTVNARFADGRTFDENGLTVIEAHLASNWRFGQIVATEFDDLFYLSIYRDVQFSGMPPLLHYARIGKREGRLTTRPSVAETAHAIRGAMDERFYAAQGPLLPGMDAAEDYAASGWRLGKDPHPSFSTTYYLTTYADIQSAKINPYNHFLIDGRREGRKGRPDFSSVLRRGELAFDVRKRTVILAIHEASRTGAPLLGLDVGRELSKTCNVVFYTPVTGAIYDDLLRNSCFVGVGRFTQLEYQFLLSEFKESLRIDVLIANSVETIELIEAAMYAGIPSVALIHEFADYTLPPGRVTRAVLSADIVVFPSRLVAKAAQAEIERVRQGPSRNVRIRHQGKLESLGKRAPDETILTAANIRELVRADSDKVKIVLGAGHVQTRKGVDAFVQAAAEVRDIHGDDFRFVWVGAGYNPDSDIHCAVWVRSAVERLGLEDHVFFIPQQPDIDGFIEACDVFFLSSRLDPFPNVVIDALAIGRKIVCFEEATGVADWIDDGKIEGETVRFGDTTRAAQAIVRAFEGDRVSKSNAALAKSGFKMADYITDLLGFADEAVTFRTEMMSVVDRLEQVGAFDSRFYSAVEQTTIEARRSLIEYTARGLKGVIPYNPRPGFSDALYRTQNDLIGAAVVPLDHAVATTGDGRPSTHRYQLLSDVAGEQAPLKTAIHLHLHYADLAGDFEKRISAAFVRADIFVTVTSERGRLEVEYAFRDYQNGKVVVERLPNRGRDVAPMLHVLRTHDLSRYDVFGHFHGKKTLIDGITRGALWRDFLLDTLIGTKDTASGMLSLFARSGKLGLLFAEDRLGVAWTKNRRYAESLVERLDPKPKIVPLPVFPLGTMFWARPAALSPLLSVDFAPWEMPLEPVPEDGSMLHAIERLLPSIVEANGYSWMTVRRDRIDRLY